MCSWVRLLVWLELLVRPCYLEGLAVRLHSSLLRLRMRMHPRRLLMIACAGMTILPLPQLTSMGAILVVGLSRLCFGCWRVPRLSLQELDVFVSLMTAGKRLHSDVGLFDWMFLVMFGLVKISGMCVDYLWNACPKNTLRLLVTLLRLSAKTTIALLSRFNCLSLVISLFRWLLTYAITVQQVCCTCVTILGDWLTTLVFRHEPIYWL